MQKYSDFFVPPDPVIGVVFANFRVRTTFFSTRSRTSGWVIGRVFGNFRVLCKKFENFFGWAGHRRMLGIKEPGVTMKCDILILSGLWNSGPQHWQTHWESAFPAWRRVAHRDWISPERDEWVAELDAAIAACEGRPILVAHSLGCMLTAQWA